ncbi:MAG TPA: transcription-repair coupling factor [Lentisphaeria bacterium]|nr:MAG: transcription-repair coupling factor [Lentisphaerae bacterium GWF2_49_21]HBC87022.1 transcription-repair coupling factor [Lentisphaeria bacterium]
MKHIVWKKELNNWISGGIEAGNTFLNVDPDTMFPVLMRALQGCPESVIIIVPRLSIAEFISSNLSSWGDICNRNLSPVLIPETEEGERFMPENEFQRMKALYLAASGKNGNIFIASAISFTSPVPELDSIDKNTIKLTKGMNISLKDLTKKLVDMDYDDEIEVNTPGEFARRGGIIDIFSPGSANPARIELWGDEISSIRTFSVETQLSLENVKEYTVIMRNSFVSGKTSSSLMSYFKGRKPRLIVVNPGECITHLQRFGKDSSMETFNASLEKLSADTVRLLDPADSSSEETGVDCDCVSPVLEIKKTVSGETEGAYSSLIRKLTAGQLSSWLAEGYRVALLGSGESSHERIISWCNENGIKKDSVEIDISEITSGFVLPSAKLAVLTEHEMFLMHHQRFANFAPMKKLKESLKSRGMPTIADIEEGDYVVHNEYGIGIFKELKTVTEKGVSQEMLKIEFADNVTVYVPLWHADMVSRYTGAGKNMPVLSKIGSKKWSKSKIEAVRSVRGLAIDMIRIQAMRSHNPGFSFPKDDPDQHSFEELFRFPETPDQRKSTDEIKKDMCSHVPMDRLLCGDVGYGKTEVAMRAAFKAVNAGKQVAVLVPTTVLAQQHLYTFSERFSEFPFIIEMISRFRTHGEQREILQSLSEGKIDIIIGTHRLIQKDVAFKNLGLIIVDEEQRFGVEHKERLKHLRATVDILTMTATPIPRTLYMAMTGVRDLSTIMTPPGLRLPVQTIVCKYDEKHIREAISREIQRGGQVFYLHNRINSIENTCKKLKALVPSANFAIGHGRMPEHELEKVMMDFLDGKTDVLVSTTIIESGLDIPNANTIIMERADRFGLAELYQLRGRVGRWTRQAYAYLLLPPHTILEGTVRERISAIRRYTHLGAGFKLALRDLEIRGAGNILGAEQSGHINKIGFDLYCTFLKSAVAELKGKPEKFIPQTDIFIDFIDFAHETEGRRVSAALPPEYIPSDKLRIDAYRQLCRTAGSEELDQKASELEDRYGKIPVTARNLIKVYKIRLSLAESGYKFLNVKNNVVTLGPDLKKQKGESTYFLKEKEPGKKIDELYKLIKGLVE